MKSIKKELLKDGLKVEQWKFVRLVFLLIVALVLVWMINHTYVSNFTETLSLMSDEVVS